MCLLPAVLTFPEGIFELCKTTGRTNATGYIDSYDITNMDKNPYLLQSSIVNSTVAAANDEDGNDVSASTDNDCDD